MVGVVYLIVEEVYWDLYMDVCVVVGFVIGIDRVVVLDCFQCVDFGFDYFVVGLVVQIYDQIDVVG